MDHGSGRGEVRRGLRPTTGHARTTFTPTPAPGVGWHRLPRTRPAATGAPAPEVNFPPHLMLGKFNTFNTFNTFNRVAPARLPPRLPHGAGCPLDRLGIRGHRGLVTGFWTQPEACSKGVLRRSVHTLIVYRPETWVTDVQGHG